MIVSGSVNNETYQNNGAASVFMMLYPENDPANLTIYNNLLNLNNGSYNIVYSEPLSINGQTELEALQTQIFDDVETSMLNAEYTYAPGITKIQNTVFNYVTGKTNHVLQTPQAAFSSEYLQFYFEERNGYQLYLNIYDNSQSQSWDVYLMDKTAANQPQYDHLYGLTNSNSFPPVTSTIIVDFANANLHEGMGTVAAINECKRYLATITSANGITHQRTLDQMEAFATHYAVTAFGDVFFNDDANDLWGMELKYNAYTNNNNNTPLQNAALYNGNISEMTWQSRSDNQKRGYGYQYDGLNRLTKAVYRGYKASAGNWNMESYRYNVPYITYDLNGNIQTLKRKGFTSGVINQNAGFGVMDDLTYTYSGDQLLSISDASVHYQNDFQDGNTQGNDYSYDANGNMTQDLNKGITITYNHLNLPRTVSNGSNQTINYIYDAAGTKLQKVYNNNGSNTTTDYSAIGNYTTPPGGSRALDFIFADEGRLVDDNGSYRYEYYYKDHLGNTRLGFSDYNNDQEISTSEITQQKNYYPFGLSHEGTYYGTPTLTSHKYLYNGMERQDEMGINMYSMDFRQLDPAVGRWTGIDPVIHYDFSPYNSFDNNPIYWIDPSGANATKYEDEDGNLIVKTNDGSDDVVTVPEAKYEEFQLNLHWSSKHRRNSKGWNDYWKTELIGFEDIDQMNLVLSFPSSQWSRNLLIQYWQDKTNSNYAKYLGAELVSQALNPLSYAPGPVSTTAKAILLPKPRVKIKVKVDTPKPKPRVDPITPKPKAPQPQVETPTASAKVPKTKTSKPSSAVETPGSIAQSSTSSGTGTRNTTNNPWIKFNQAMGKGKFTKDKYGGSSKAAFKARIKAYKAWKKANGN